MSDTEVQQKVLVRIAKVELSILSFDDIICSVSIGPVKRSSCSRLIDECSGRGVLIRVSAVKVK